MYILFVNIDIAVTLGITITTLRHRPKSWKNYLVWKWQTERAMIKWGEEGIKTEDGLDESKALNQRNTFIFPFFIFFFHWGYILKPTATYNTLSFGSIQPKCRFCPVHGLPLCSLKASYLMSNKEHKRETVDNLDASFLNLELHITVSRLTHRKIPLPDTEKISKNILRDYTSSIS